MAAPEAVVNIYDASFGGAELHRAVSLELDGLAAEVLSAGSDNEMFPTIVQVVGRKLKFSVRLMDLVGAVGVSVGSSGSFSCKLAALGTGAAQQLTIANSVCTGVSASSAHGKAGEALLRFEAASSDGVTSPLSISDVE